jgi:HEAT repeat protein
MVDALKDSDDPMVTDLLIGTLEHANSGWAAAKALGGRRSLRAVPQIIEAVRGSSPGDLLRADAAVAVGQIGDPRGVAALETILHSPRPPGPSWIKTSSIHENTARIRAIGASFRLDAKSKLGNQYFSELEDYAETPYGNLKPIVIAELGQIPKPQALKMIREALKDPAPDVRASAVRALAKQRPTDFAAALKPLEKDPDPMVRAATEGALTGRPN